MAHQTSTQPLSILTDVPLVLEKVYLVNCNLCKPLCLRQEELAYRQEGIAPEKWQPFFPPHG